MKTQYLRKKYNYKNCSLCRMWFTFKIRAKDANSFNKGVFEI